MCVNVCIHAYMYGCKRVCVLPAGLQVPTSNIGVFLVYSFIYLDVVLRICDI